MNIVRNKVNVWMAAIVVILSAKATQAHPGHGDTDGHSLFHHVTEPVHALPLLAALTIAALAAFWIYRKWFRVAKNNDTRELVS